MGLTPMDESKPVVELAHCIGLKVERGEFNAVHLRGSFRYFSGESQDFGDMIIDDDFIKRLLHVFDATEMDDIGEERNCVILHDKTKILRISNGSRAFDVQAWRKEVGIEE
jgi:hypothetical protein